jgi:hypothetical protein
MSGFSPAVLRALKIRSGGICEGCGEHAATEAHHIQYRSRGGSETLENALHLCGWGNHTGCHGVAHSGRAGEAKGWSVRTGFKPGVVPVLLFTGWARLSSEPGVPPLKMITSDAVEYMTLIGAIRTGWAA